MAGEAFPPDGSLPNIARKFRAVPKHADVLNKVASRSLLLRTRGEMLRRNASVGFSVTAAVWAILVEMPVEPDALVERYVPEAAR